MHFFRLHCTSAGPSRSRFRGWAAQGRAAPGNALAQGVAARAPAKAQ